VYVEVCAALQELLPGGKRWLTSGRYFVLSSMAEFMQMQVPRNPKTTQGQVLASFEQWLPYLDLCGFTPLPEVRRNGQT
jgi:hypothetical protein